MSPVTDQGQLFEVETKPVLKGMAGSNLFPIIAVSLKKHQNRECIRKTLCFCLFANCHGHGLVSIQLDCILCQLNGFAVRSCSGAVCRAREAWHGGSPVLGVSWHRQDLRIPCRSSCLPFLIHAKIRKIYLRLMSQLLL